MKFSTINYQCVFLLIILIVSCSCTYTKKNEKKGLIDADDSITVENDLILQQKKDSRHAGLIAKINNDSIYVPIVDYIIDNIVPVYTDSDCIDELFFENPSTFLNKTKVNDKVLVTAELTVPKLQLYFLLDEAYNIIDKIELSTYREAVDRREIYDWNKDGKQDIVETRRYHGQMFSTITKVVYSIADNTIKRVFSLETHELNCATTNDNNDGVVVQREYRQIEPDIFQISEVKGYVKCENDTDIPDNAKPFKIISRKKYEMTTNELLKKYGQQYGE